MRFLRWAGHLFTRVDKDGVPCHCQWVSFSYGEFSLTATFLTGEKVWFDCDALVRTGVDLMQHNLSGEQLADAYESADKWAEENRAEIYGRATYSAVPESTQLH